jgi:hypothetical protein
VGLALDRPLIVSTTKGGPRRTDPDLEGPAWGRASAGISVPCAPPSDCCPQLADGADRAQPGPAIPPRRDARRALACLRQAGCSLGRTRSMTT